MTKVYIETSALGFYFDDRFPKIRDTIRLLLVRVQAGELDAFTSEATLEEVRGARADLAARLVAVVQQSGMPVLPVSRKAELLAEAYVQAGIVPEDYADDATHLAVSVLEGADLLVTYNLKHFANPRAIQRINAFNTSHRLRLVEIRTPDKVP